MGLFIYLPIRRNSLPLFDDDDITWDDLAGLNFQLFPITNDLVCVKPSTNEDVRSSGRERTMAFMAMPALSCSTMSPACFSWYQPTKALSIRIPI